MPNFGQFIQQILFWRFERLDIWFDADAQVGDFAVSAHNGMQLGQLIDAFNVDLLFGEFMTEFGR